MQLPSLPSLSDLVWPLLPSSLSLSLLLPPLPPSPPSSPLFTFLHLQYGGGCSELRQLWRSGPLLHWQAEQTHCVGSTRQQARHFQPFLWLFPPCKNPALLLFWLDSASPPVTVALKKKKKKRSCVCSSGMLQKPWLQFGLNVAQKCSTGAQLVTVTITNYHNKNNLIRFYRKTASRVLAVHNTPTSLWKMCWVYCYWSFGRLNCDVLKRSAFLLIMQQLEIFFDLMLVSSCLLCKSLRLRIWLLW